MSSEHEIFHGESGNPIDDTPTNTKAFRPPTPWQPIGTAPRLLYGEGVKIDLLCKTWDRDKDVFHFIRCPDCSWNASRGDWSGLRDGYRAIAWMPVPEIPEDQP